MSNQLEDAESYRRTLDEHLDQIPMTKDQRYEVNWNMNRIMEIVEALTK